MGWSSGGEIFDVVAEVAKEKFENGDLKLQDGADILNALFVSLKEGDWDTEDESFEDHPLIIEVFLKQGYYIMRYRDDGGIFTAIDPGNYSALEAVIVAEPNERY